MTHTKKISLFIAAALSIFLAACSSSKEAGTMKKSINGNWTLKTITVEGNNNIINVKVFNEADNNCFIGGTWHFVSNNGTGNYTLPSSADGCTALTRKIRWTIYEPAGEVKQLQFKRLDEKSNPLDDNNGYRLSIASLTDSSMQLKSAITYDNKPVAVIYNFLKN